MNQDIEGKQRDKKKMVIMTLVALGVFALITTGGVLILSKIKSKNNAAEAAGSQEQFAGQAETSQQLQSECQNSANEIAKSEDIETAIDEFKKHVENCREVYFTSEEKTQYRNEGMYPDLGVDLFTKLAATDKARAVEFMAYLKKLQPWQFYMGPIVCDSQNVLNAYDESLRNEEPRLCVKFEEFNEKIYNELKNKNFSVLSSTLNSNNVAWLGAGSSDLGCPERISAIVKTVQSSAGSSQIRPVQQKQESTGLNVIFGNGTEDDKVVLEFGEVNGCFQLKSAAVAGLQTNE
ncbi:MAG: hypothetical protein K0R29_422 [Pseudobdellovibrio sp.]|nr:hypothetical protein [Pseudobdellovibrio sp.]